MKTLVQRIVTDIKNRPHDERVTQVRGQSSWYAGLALFAMYLIIGAGYIVKTGMVPWQLQLMFFVPLLVFFITTLKNNGVQFMIPGMKETDATLEQPASVRSIPWLITVYGIILAADMAVFTLIPLFTGEAFTEPAAGLTSKIIDYVMWVVLTVLFGGLLVGYQAFVASRIKRGDKLFMVTTFLWNLAVLLIISTANYSLKGVLFAGSTPASPKEVLIAQAFIPNGIFILSALWTCRVLLGNWKRMREDGKSYVQDSDYNYKKERLARNLCAIAAVIMATVGVIGAIISIVTLFVPAILIPLPQ